MIDIKRITASKLKSGIFKREFPDYYALSSIVENNLWHNNQNVFDHVVRVYENLEKELRFSDLSRENKELATEYFESKVEILTKGDLLKIATLLHDIAKIDTLITYSKGQASCPGHELLGASRVSKYAPLFELSPAETKRVRSLVLYHGFISQILDQVVAKPEKETYFRNQFVETVGDVEYDLVILMRADLHGCDLQRMAPGEFAARENVLKNWIRRI